MLRILSQSAMLKCPYCIMMPSHYRSDNTCRCDDPAHTEMQDWGYTWDNDHWIAQEEEEDC